jgi:hypothetical protein
MRRRAAIEPVIGHLKDDHRMGRNHLKGREGDRINAVLARRRLQLQPTPALVRAASACSLAHHRSPTMTPRLA